MTRLTNNFLHLIIWIFFSLQVVAQIQMVDTAKIKKITISKVDLDSYKKQKAFDYHPVEEKDNFIISAFKWLKLKIKLLFFKFLKWLMGAKHAASWLKYILKSLPYLAVLMFSFILFKFLIGTDLIRGRKQVSKASEVKFDSEDEALIKEFDLEALIQMAIQKKDFRLAVRYNYLLVLQKLLAYQLIDWHPDKTNHDYVKELSRKDLKKEFNNLTRIYDYIWYGKYIPAFNEFTTIEQQFSVFEKKI